MNGYAATNSANSGTVTVSFPATEICLECHSASCPGCGNLYFAGGDGTINNPYRIINIQQLLSVHSFDGSNKYFKLGADINSSISKKTNFFIIGEDFGPKKMEQVQKLQAEGYDIKILDENELMNELTKNRVLFLR